MYVLMVHIVAICIMLCIIIMREHVKYIFSVLEEQGISTYHGTNVHNPTIRRAPSFSYSHAI